MSYKIAMIDKSDRSCWLAEFYKNPSRSSFLLSARLPAWAAHASQSMVDQLQTADTAALFNPEPSIFDPAMSSLHGKSKLGNVRGQ